jgi:rRNA maturation RNase YbeY
MLTAPRVASLQGQRLPPSGLIPRAIEFPPRERWRGSCLRPRGWSGCAGRFRGKNKATDVLSFPSATPTLVSKSRPGAPADLGTRADVGVPDIAGDLAISVDTARKQAAGLGHALRVEIKVLMLHGLLHLAGYDHETDEGEMGRLEERLRAKLRLPHGLIERSVVA